MTSTLSTQMAVGVGATQGWQAELKLGFASRAGKSVLVQREHCGPLTVQRPFYPEGASLAHTYILHPPGGLVGGDTLRLDLQVDAAAQVLATTPGATKFYRSAGTQASQLQQFRVASAASLEWLPQETILFPQANALLTTHLQLDHRAQYIGWEVVSLGRPTIHEPFTGGLAEFRTQVFQGRKPLFLDRWRISTDDDLSSSAGLRGCPVVATLLALPANREVLGQARHWCELCTQGSAGATLFNGLLVVRYLGSSTAQVHLLFRQIWAAIRPLMLGREACAPRIWST